jgi:hypothetical protein
MKTEFPDTAFGISDLTSMEIMRAHNVIYGTLPIDLCEMADLEVLGEICDKLTQVTDLIFSCEDYQGSRSICREYATADLEETETDFHELTEKHLKPLFGRNCIAF